MLSDNSWKSPSFLISLASSKYASLERSFMFGGKDPNHEIYKSCRLPRVTSLSIDSECVIDTGINFINIVYCSVKSLILFGHGRKNYNRWIYLNEHPCKIRLLRWKPDLSFIFCKLKTSYIGKVIYVWRENGDN